LNIDFAHTSRGRAFAVNRVCAGQIGSRNRRRFEFFLDSAFGGIATISITANEGRLVLGKDPPGEALDPVRISDNND
jgi:hypothetical protein